MQNFTKRIGIMGIIALLAFISSACVTAPPTLELAQDIALGPKHLPLSQKIIEPGDPRMPPPLNLEVLQGQELYGGRPSVLKTGGGVDLTIDGKRIGRKELVFLEPGKHRVSYISESHKTVTTDFAGNTKTVRITTPVNMEIDMKPSKVYTIEGNITETRDSSFNRNVLGFNSVEYAGEFRVVEKDYVNQSPLYLGIYLEPYDETIPPESQTSFEIYRGIYIVEFDGQSVRWGLGFGSGEPWVTIGIPKGEHTVKAVSLFTGERYSGTINCNGSSYAIINPLGSTDIRGLTKEGGLFNFEEAASLLPAPAEFNGPEITVNYDTWSNSLYMPHLYISPAGENSWGENLLKPGQILKDEDSVTLRLPRPIDQVNSYDILIFDSHPNVFTAYRQRLTPGCKIGFGTGRDFNKIFVTTD